MGGAGGAGACGGDSTSSGPFLLLASSSKSSSFRLTPREVISADILSHLAKVVAIGGGTECSCIKGKAVS